MHDVIIIGGGPAGLSAALILGRCRRRVLVCDAGTPRNAASPALHGFLTRDGIPPLELLRIGREQLHRYESVELIDAEAVDAQKRDRGFEITLADRTRHGCRMLLLATGVTDALPPIDGIHAFYGKSVFHCPYCDGWEWRDQPLAIYGHGRQGASLALELTVWSDDLVLCTDGPGELSHEAREQLADRGIALHERPVDRLEGSDGMLEEIVLANGERLRRRALFFSTGFHQDSRLPAKLGCDLTRKDVVPTGAYETTNVPGLFVAGDASREVQLAIVAAAEGAKAAFAINTALSERAVRQ